MEPKSLIELNHAISMTFRELNEAQSNLEQTLASVEQARETLTNLRARANGAFIEALDHFTKNPADIPSEIFHGICRLAEDAGFDVIGDELRKLSAKS